VKLEIKVIPLWRAEVAWGVVEGSVAGNDSSHEDFVYHVLRICVSCLKHIASPDRDTPLLSVT
jgi:hypothetical protein